MKCPVCENEQANYGSLAEHFIDLANKNDVGHVMWLNRNITKSKIEADLLEEKLEEFLDYSAIGLKRWMINRFVQRFFGKKPHPFVLALQHPSRAVILGYVLEHQHFLKQWVKSLSWVIAKTDSEEVIKEEISNIVTEYYGSNGKKSHFELLILMGESYGMDRAEILTTKPLPATSSALEFWQNIGMNRHWVETMAAMHSLELIANRDVKKYGATITYFDPSILNSNEITEEAKEFLYEGYEADVEHSEVPLEMVEKYAKQCGLEQDVQITFLRSIDKFDLYLSARLERAMRFDPSLIRFIGG